MHCLTSLGHSPAPSLAHGGRTASLRMECLQQVCVCVCACVCACVCVCVCVCVLAVHVHATVACCSPCRHTCGGTYICIYVAHTMSYHYYYPQCSWVHGVLTNHDMSSSILIVSCIFPLPFYHTLLFKAALVMPPRRGTVSSFPPLCPLGSTLSTLALTLELPPYTRCTCLPMCSVILKYTIYSSNENYIIM